MIDAVVIHDCRVQRLDQGEARHRSFVTIGDCGFPLGDIFPPHEEDEHPIHPVPMQPFRCRPPFRLWPRFDAKLVHLHMPAIRPQGYGGKAGKQMVAELQHGGGRGVRGDRLADRLEPAGDAAIERIIIPALVMRLVGFPLDCAAADREGGETAAAIAAAIGHIAVEPEVIPTIRETGPIPHSTGFQDGAHGVGLDLREALRFQRPCDVGLPIRFHVLAILSCVLFTQEGFVHDRERSRWGGRRRGIMFMTQPPIGITMGDPAGIGPEIVVKFFAEGVPAPCVVIGDAVILRRAVALLGMDLAVEEIDQPDHANAAPGRIGVVPVSALPADLPFGRVSAQAGKAAYAYITRAIDEVQAGRISAIVTAPISKQAMHEAGIDYPGHTEILAERAGSTDYAMMLANEELRVLLVSIHVSLTDAIAAVTEENELRAIRLADLAGRQFGIARPRVAVAGLNPHAGEGGMFGHEDGGIIAPAVAQARAEGIDATGPLSGDTVFMRARRGEFDVVVAQYHDQGLIPVKYLGLDHGVNITVGLPFVRTSVDHGTAFEIAGTGQASAASLRAAVLQAMAMIR